jgi:excisionase family DNA binding protein
MSEQHQPEIERLLAAPGEAERVPLADLPGLLVRLASAQLQLAGLQAALLARMQTAPDGRAGTGDRLLDMEAVAEVLNVPVAHAREMGRRHELPTVRVGRYMKVRESSLQKWLQQREELGGPPRREYHPRPKRTGRASARVVPLHQPEADR